MERPREKDLRAALAFVLDLGDAPDLDAFAQQAVVGLQSVIPADIVAYNELDLGRARTFVLVDPPDARFDNVEEVLAQHMRDNPLVVHYERERGGSPRTISDFITRRELHRRPLYAELFKGLEIEYQMVANLPTSSLLIGIVFNRSHRDFNERERELLDLVRPHLARAYEHARARALLASLEAAADEDGRGLLVLGRNGRVEHATPGARAVLEALGAPRGGDDGLPPPLDAWGDAEPVASPLVVALDDRQIRVRVLPGNRRTVLLEEERPVSAESLSSLLGLSAREGEVLALVTAGRTNAEIGLRLGISQRTVVKHLEHVFAKLGVGTRTAAAAKAFEVCGYRGPDTVFGPS
jgi:DNA-binding CsgD family transcriptional regulator